jgi:phosphogluconate dehydratase
MPSLISVQQRGHAVALVTDGRLSGASGKIPAAIHLTPECVEGGPISRILDGDIIEFDAEAGTLKLEVAEETLVARTPHSPGPRHAGWSHGRGMFSLLRAAAQGAEQGGSSLELGGPGDAS